MRILGALASFPIFAVAVLIGWTADVLRAVCCDLLALEIRLVEASIWLASAPKKETP